MNEKDTGADLTELFAYFGRAVYMANVLEVALAQTLLQIEFMTNVRVEFVRTKGKDFDPRKYEDEFDTYFEKQLSQTMGALAKRLEVFSEVGDVLKGEISKAIARRNFLIHDYWREMDVSFMTEEGRASMIEELSKDIDTFERLAIDLLTETKPVRKRLGIHEEELDARVENRMAEVTGGMILDR